MKAVLTKNETRSCRCGNSELTRQRTDNAINHLINITAKAGDEDSALTANSILPLSSWHKRLDNVSNIVALKITNRKIGVRLNLYLHYPDSNVPSIECTQYVCKNASVTVSRRKNESYSY